MESIFPCPLDLAAPVLTLAAPDRFITICDRGIIESETAEDAHEVHQWFASRSDDDFCTPN